MNINNTCPICHKELKKDEKLIAEYYPPKDWWTILHLRPQKEGELPSGRPDNLHTVCALAGFQIASQ